VDVAARNLEIDVVNGGEALEFLGQSGRFEDEVAHDGSMD
jgi:hypothetical protein